MAPRSDRGTPCPARTVRPRSRHDACCLYDEHAGWLRLERGEVTVAVNFSWHAAAVPLGGRPASGVHLASGGAELKHGAVELEARSVALSSPEPQSQPSSARRSSSMPKWCATSWITVRLTWARISAGVPPRRSIGPWKMKITSGRAWS